MNKRSMRRVTRALFIGSLSATFLASPVRAASYTVLYAFLGGDGATPEASLIDLNGEFYGTTAGGGAHGDGTVFSMTPAGIENVIYSFRGAHGVGPASPLVQLGGALYGTTERGGTAKFGTVFRVTPTAVEKVLHSFTGGSDGILPLAGLINVRGTLYGTTNSGGGAGFGTVFKITRAGVKTVAYSFQDGSDGAFPSGTMIDVDGTLYGTTFEGGGGGGCGTVFSLTTLGVETVVYAFKCDNHDGVYPAASLVRVGGVFYGTTQFGGAYGNGTVFRLTKAGHENLVYSFVEGNDGAHPTAPLIELGGTLYGTTLQGGGSGANSGTIFSLTTAGVETVLHSFAGGSDGVYPVAGLVNVDGTLYGTTQNGGGSAACSGGCGTVFSVMP